MFFYYVYTPTYPKAEWYYGKQLTSKPFYFKHSSQGPPPYLTWVNMAPVGTPYQIDIIVIFISLVSIWYWNNITLTLCDIWGLSCQCDFISISNWKQWDKKITSQCCQFDMVCLLGYIICRSSLCTVKKATITMVILTCFWMYL